MSYNNNNYNDSSSYPPLPTRLHRHQPNYSANRSTTRTHNQPPGRTHTNQEQEHNPFDLSTNLNQLNLNSDNSNVINFDAYEDIPVETTGSDIPPPVNTFAEIRLGKALDDNIRRCKYVKPTPIQRHAIPVALAGRDLMACAQTGSGKTAAFCFPIISGILKQNGTTPFGSGRRMRVACPLALIMSPTRELSCQIHDEAKKFSHQTGVKVVVAYGGAPINRQLQNLEKGVDILVATPGRLVDMIERERISLKRIKYLALDEADRMLDMGFERQIRQIVEEMGMPPPGARQTLLFSATFPTEIQRLASDFLKNYIFLSVGRVGSSTDLIDQRVELVQDMDKRSRLMDILKDQRSNGMTGKFALTLVFVETKRGADLLEHWLCGNGYSATAIHGDKVQMERERALRSFKNGSTPILVATDVAARGLDVPHVTHVINFDLPKDIDDYVHRIGRTGRAGKSGLATAFFSEKNSSLAKALAQLMQESNQQVPTWLTQYAETSSSYGNGRSYRGGSKFGGHDFRSSSNNGGGGKYSDYGSGSKYSDNGSGSNYGNYGSGSNYGNYGTDYKANKGPADYTYSDYSGTNPGDSTYSDYSGHDFAAAGVDAHSGNEFPAAGHVDAYASGGAPAYQSEIVATGWD
ncbi:RNA helicase [Heracleum sosnowskyi]|uniref:RNA helicase n=1 Tax=Heracleum sosnowskyi TaxID=360622 RepID=A0AAD8IXB0_9APIA|nr:RNA helicase [Heracleum sosnowskyi]